MTVLTIRCAWCGEILGEKDGQGVEGVSNGICDSCLVRNFPHIAEKVIGDKEVEVKE